MGDYLSQGAVREWGITSHRALYVNGGLPPIGGAVREWGITSHRGL